LVVSFRPTLASSSACAIVNVLLDVCFLGEAS
jgi:hypothetical protein